MFTRGPAQLVLRGHPAPRRVVRRHLPLRGLPLRGTSGATWLALVGVGASAGCQQVLGNVELVGDEPVQVVYGERPASCADAGSTPCTSGSCVPGSFRCTDARLEACGASGVDWRFVAQCASAGLCAASAGLCLPPTCDALQYDCSDAGALLVCNPERNGFELVTPCGSRALCNSVRGQEGCEPAVCSAGARRCNGAQLEECRADQKGYSAVQPACVSAALCREDAPGRAHCEPATCAAGDYSCDGRQLRRCSEDRSAWLVVDRCISAPLCNPAAKLCDPPTCQLGQQRCTGSVLERCNADQDGFAVVVDCLNPALCDQRVMTCLTTPAPVPANPTPQ